MTQFELMETALTPLWDFGWFDVSVFKVTGVPDGATSEAVLRSLQASAIFRRSFCTRPDPWGGDVDTHGPLLASELPDAAYERISHDQLVAEVHAILADPEFDMPPSSEQQAPVAAWLATARSDECFALRRSSDGRGEVDWDVWLVFREFICVAHDGDRITVAVVGFD